MTTNPLNLTSLQAVRLLGELVQADGIPAEQIALLMELTDLTEEELNIIFSQCSDLWDDLKERLALGSAARLCTPS